MLNQKVFDPQCLTREAHVRLHSPSEPSSANGSAGTLNTASVVLPLCILFTVPSGDSQPSSTRPHPSITISLSPLLLLFYFFPPTCLRPPTRGEAVKRGNTTMTRANVWPFCVAVTEAIVSPKQWTDANSECSDCDRVLLTMKTPFEPLKDTFF